MWGLSNEGITRKVEQEERHFQQLLATYSCTYVSNVILIGYKFDAFKWLMHQRLNFLRNFSNNLGRDLGGGEGSNKNKVRN